MNKELNAAEAVYGFVGWLTCREERTVMSAKDDCAPIAELIKRFCTENNLPEVSDQWPLNLIHPSGEVAVPNAARAPAGEYPPLVCDYCGALTPDPWHSSGMMNGKMSKHIHSCDVCAALEATQASLADPMQWTLPCDVKVGHVTIPKGCALNTLVTRMQVLYEMGVDAPERQYARGFRHGYNQRDAEVNGALL